jgi:hypothetical protein
MSGFPSLQVMAARADNSSGSGDMLHNIVNGTPGELTAYIILNFIPAHFGLPVLVALILFSKQVQRHPTFLNLLLAFIVTGTSSCILLYTGYLYGPEPPKGLCLFQASMLYGVPPLCSMTAFFLVFQMWSMIRATFAGDTSATRAESPVKLWAMLVAPYVGFTIAALVTAIYGTSHPNQVSRNRRYFYCSLKASIISNGVSIVTICFLLATLFFGAWTVVILYKRYMGLRRQGISLNSSFELNLPSRVLAFAMYTTLATSLCLLSIWAPASSVPDLAIATAASFVLLIFGTQMDIINALCFWRSAKPVALSKTSAMDLKSDSPA